MAKYQELIDSLDTFDEAIADINVFQDALEEYEELRWVDNDSTTLFENFIYYVLHYVYGTDKINYTDVDDFKKRLAETYFQEQPLLFKKWQYLIDILDEDTTDALYRMVRERTGTLETDTTASATFEQTDNTFNKSADTPTNIYTPITSFVDQYTNAMANTSNEQENESSNTGNATTTSGDTEREGLDKLFSIFNTFPKSLVMQVASKFAHHFVSVYLDEESFID